MIKDGCQHDKPGIAHYEGFGVYDHELGCLVNRKAVFTYPCGCSIKYRDGKVVDDE